MVKDRRKGEERRTVRRYVVNIDVEWEGVVGRQQGTLSDISLLGCFVLCSGEVEDGESVKLFLPLGDGMNVQFLGEVVNHVFEIGFGLRFGDLTEAQKELLTKMTDSLS